MEESPLAGKTVKIISGEFEGSDYRVEGYWIKVAGKSWRVCDGNPACLKYAIRSAMDDGIPNDDKVFYGKIGAFGHLVHESEVEEVPR